MRILQFAILAVMAAGLAFGAAACSKGPSMAWCANTGELGGLDCSYRSFEQCREFVFGAGGSCTQNPRGPGRAGGRSSGR
jgi:hypothetical protein